MFSDFQYNAVMIIIPMFSLFIYKQINKDNRLMIYVHKNHVCVYYIIKALISILAITMLIYMKYIFNTVLIL